MLSSSNSFTTPVLNTTTNYYVSASGCSAALRVLVKATVNPATIGGNVNGGSTVVAGSNSTTLTLSNYTGNIVKWQSSTDNFIANIVDIANTTDQLTVTNLTTTTTKFKTQVKSGTCSNVFSSAATITVTGALPILVNSIKAIRENNTIRIQWTAYAENNTQSYVVEHSTDGVNFSKIYSTIPAAGNGNNTYNGIDNSPVQGYNFYRIKDILISGQATYSTTVKVLYEDSKSGISIFPNPVVDDMVTLQFNNMKKGTYDINVINNLGEVIGRTSYIHPGGFYAKTINLPANLSNGVYRVNISNTAMDKKSYAIMVSK